MSTHIINLRSALDGELLNVWLACSTSWKPIDWHHTNAVTEQALIALIGIGVCQGWARVTLTRFGEARRVAADYVYSGAVDFTQAQFHHQAMATVGWPIDATTEVNLKLHALRYHPKLGDIEMTGDKAEWYTKVLRPRLLREDGGRPVAHPTCECVSAFCPITAAVAERRYEVTRKTLQRAIKDGRLTDRRDHAKATNSPLLLDELEVEQHFPRRAGTM